MPSGDGWGELARRQFGKALHSQERTSFSTADLAEEHLTGLLAVNPHQEKIVPLDAELAASLSAAPEGYFNLSDFASPADFALRGLGFTFLSAGEPAGVAYSSLVCSQGIEVSIYVTKPHRRRGVATALGSRLLLACLEKQLRPNWDAANLESVRLAEKLGYRRRGSYDAFYRLEK
jgi:GNAT superfamily N-acetyltransferase